MFKTILRLISARKVILEDTPQLTRKIVKKGLFSTTCTTTFKR